MHVDVRAERADEIPFAEVFPILLYVVLVIFTTAAEGLYAGIGRARPDALPWMVVSVRCAPGTFDPPTTHIQVGLDVDQNPATGDPFEGLGLEYVINMGSSNYGAEAEVLRFSGDPGYRRVGTVPVSLVGDGTDVGIPLSMLGDEDGRLAFRVVTSYYLGANGFTGILDYMPAAEHLAPSFAERTAAPSYESPSGSSYLTRGSAPQNGRRDEGGQGCAAKPACCSWWRRV
jgi:hypothetical protein